MKRSESHVDPMFFAEERGNSMLAKGPKLPVAREIGFRCLGCCLHLIRRSCTRLTSADY